MEHSRTAGLDDWSRSSWWEFGSTRWPFSRTAIFRITEVDGSNVFFLVADDKPSKIIEVLDELDGAKRWKQGWHKDWLELVEEEEKTNGI